MFVSVAHEWLRLLSLVMLLTVATRAVSLPLGLILEYWLLRSVYCLVVLFHLLGCCQDQKYDNSSLTIHCHLCSPGNHVGKAAAARASPATASMLLLCGSGYVLANVFAGAHDHMMMIIAICIIMTMVMMVKKMMMMLTMMMMAVMMAVMIMTVGMTMMMMTGTTVLPISCRAD